MRWSRAQVRTLGGLLVLPLVVSAIAYTGGAEASSPSGLRVGSMSTEYAHNPLGIDVQRPRLSWTLESPRRGQVQTAYRILVASSAAKLRHEVGDVWDSGRVRSAESVNVTYGGPALAAQTRYFWTVRAWDGRGVASPWSKVAWWETALLRPADWQARWIGRTGVRPSTGPLLRKEFTARKPIARARAYVTGLGNYVLRINGRRVGDRVLDPAYTEYEDRVLYSTYDVGALLRRGRNALAVALGPGFYYYDTPKLLVQLRIDYADGTSEVVRSDESWQLTSGPTTFETTADNAVFAGESYDARQEPRGWDRPGFDATGWQRAEVLPAPGGVLAAQSHEPVTVAETVDPAGVAEPKPGTYVLDLGRTLTGWIRLTTKGQAGRAISIQYGEKLNADGTVNAIPSPGPRPRWQHDEFVPRGDGPETWQPSFTFKSFRYVQLDGLAAPPRAGAVQGREVHSAVRSAGDFSSSSPLYDKIHQATRRTISHVLLGFPAFDPGHEKNGWAGDTQLITPAMADNFGMAAFLAKWLDDVRDSQRPDGSISMIDPIRDGCCYAWAPEWTAAYPLVAWDLYLRYADVRVLERHYATLVKYLRWQTDSLVDGFAPPGIWGDWASPGYAYAPEDHRLTATAYIYRQSLVMADIARVLGHGDDATGYLATADQIRDRFNATFLDESAGRYVTSTDPGYRQTSNALPLAFGMVPPRYRGAVLDSLADDVRARDGHLNTGILGTPALLETLTRNGHTELAFGIVAQTTFPSWGEWIAAGADTLWEDWGLNGRSRNHPMHGTVDDWFFRDVAGIAPDPSAPGYRNTIVQPHPTSALTHAKASHLSPYGRIDVSWRLDRDSFALDVRIPANTTATVRIPTSEPAKVRESGGPAASAPGVRFVRVADGYAEFRVGSGDYRFTSIR